MREMTTQAIPTKIVERLDAQAATIVEQLAVEEDEWQLERGNHDDKATQDADQRRERVQRWPELRAQEAVRAGRSGRRTRSGRYAAARKQPGRRWPRGDAATASEPTGTSV